MSKKQYIQVGKIQKTHGLKGEMQIGIDLYAPEVLLDLKVFFLQVKNAYEPFFVESLKLSGDRAFLQFEEIQNVNQAKGLCGLSLFVDTEIMPEIEDDEVWQYDEIIGYRIVDKEKGELGVIEDVFETAGQDLISMIYQEKEVLIPVVDEIILKVNKKSKKIDVLLPKGLLELYLDDQTDDED